MNGIYIICLLYTSFTAAMRIKMFFMCPFESLGMAMATYSGQNYGAGKPERIYKEQGKSPGTEHQYTESERPINNHHQGACLDLSLIHISIRYNTTFNYEKADTTFRQVGIELIHTITKEQP